MYFMLIEFIFTIQSINFFFIYIILDYKNLKFKYLIDNITNIFNLLKKFQT